MPWTTPDGVDYDGPVHELNGITYSGQTRTPSSRRLVWSPAPPAPPVSKRKPRKKKSV